MAMTDNAFHLKPKSKWKKVDLTPDSGIDKHIGDLISFQELTDYELVKESTNETKTNEVNNQVGTGWGKLSKAICMYIEQCIISLSRYIVIH